MNRTFGSPGKYHRQDIPLTSLLLSRSALLPHRGVLSGRAASLTFVSSCISGRAEDVLRLVETRHAPVQVAAISAGAGTALHQC